MASVFSFGTELPLGRDRKAPGTCRRLRPARLGLFLAVGLTGCATSGRSNLPKSVRWGTPIAQLAQPSTPQASASPSAETHPAPSTENSSSALSQTVQKAARELAGARSDSKAWDRLAFMCDSYGPRPLGSAGLQSATAWALKTLQLDGLASARLQTLELVPWQRGKESAQIVEPVQRDLHMLGLGLSVGTPRKGLKAPLEVVGNFDQIATRGEQGQLKGKIVLVNAAMPPYDPEHNEPHYGATVPYRTQSASAAAKQGAKAVLVRSVTAKSLQTPHTGALWYDKDQPKIPAAAVTLEDAELLARLRLRGPVTVALNMEAKLASKKVESANVVAELVGSEIPDDIVLIGAHIDSWDKGPGAQDDAAGVIMVIEAMRMLHSLNLRPKRTIRAVLFTDEESGLRGAKAYMDKYGKNRHIAAIEADMGAGAPHALGLGASTKVQQALAPYLPLFAELGVQKFGDTGGGADISPLMKQGVTGISIEPKMDTYFQIHHTDADTPEKINPQDLASHAASMALMAFILAQEDLGLPASVAR